MKIFKKNIPVIGLPILCLVFFAGLSFSKVDQGHISQSAWYLQNMTEFSQSLEKLNQVASDYKFEKTDLESLRSAVKNVRLSYKKIEFILAYLYPEFTVSNINGAPLMQLEQEETVSNVVYPHGLQVLDEQVNAEEQEVFEQRNLIASVAGSLDGNFRMLYKSSNQLNISAIETLAAMRLQLIRILSMGITGFDTPGSLNGLEETKVSMNGMQNFLDINSDKAKIAQELFEKSIRYLEKNQDFESFDRLVFIRDFLDPLYAELGKLQGSKNIEKLSYTSAWNPQSKSIFGKDFLNPYFFTELTKKEDSPELRALGNELFYDPILSQDGKVSCASCHHPEKAFTDALPKSQSNTLGKTVLRNAPTLLNAVYADRYFYDLRAFSLEQQAEHVIFNPEEFNTSYISILEKLNRSSKYKQAFKNVFGKGEIDRSKFTKALASYVLTLTSHNSPFDLYIRKESENLSQEVKNGFNLFMGKANCATCHFAPTFSGLVPPLFNENESEILGVLENPDATRLMVDPDKGRIENGLRLEKDAWIYYKSFKTMTVRNIGKTAPYMHNGAFRSLEDVMDFYNRGGGEGMGLTVQNQTLSPDRLNLTDQEIKDLIAFMNALTETEK